MPKFVRLANGTEYRCEPWRKGVYYIFWTEGRRSQRKSTGATDALEAQTFLDEWVSLETGVGAATYTCADLYPLKYPPGLERGRAAWKHLGPVFGHLRPADVTDAHEAKYIAARERAGAAKSTIRYELSVLRASWNFAADPRNRLISSSDLPALGPLPKQSPPRDRWLTEDESARVLEAAEAHSPRAHLFCSIALDTAARRNAIVDLTWDQVDWQTGVIHFLPEGAEQSRKRKASVPMSERLKPILEGAYRERGASDLVIGAGSKINHTVNQVARAAQVDRLTPHVFRHTAATRMARRGVPLWLIAKVLGNTVEQVERVYAKHSPEMLTDAVNAISL